MNIWKILTILLVIILIGTFIYQTYKVPEDDILNQGSFEIPKHTMEQIYEGLKDLPGTYRICNIETDQCVGIKINEVEE